MIVDARHLGDAALERYFTLRAIGAGVVTGILAVVGILVLRSDATRTYDRLIHEALPLVLISAVCGIAVIVHARHGPAPRHPASSPPSPSPP